MYVAREIAERMVFVTSFLSLVYVMALVTP